MYIILEGTAVYLGTQLSNDLNIRQVTELMSLTALLSAEELIQTREVRLAVAILRAPI